MSVKSKLLATLSSLAFGTATVLGVTATVESAYAQPTDFFGLVTALSEACLVETNAGVYEVVTTEVAIRRCCAVVRDVGPENVDFLRAVALANPADPRLLVLDDRLVQVLLSCQQDALDRLGQLALNVNTGAGPGAGPTTNEIYLG
ncbi:MAG: hypothetical protein KIS68_12015 [Bauldia sp.]|nr:hypothetical protein [Bauldia sp.]